MNESPWKIEYRDENWFSIYQGEESEGNGFYCIYFEGYFYGFISKQAWDNLTTDKILPFVEQMLNDAHSLALKEHE